jgi:Fic family protein
MAAFERFLNAENDGMPALLRAGLAHVQFETIHPFLDGNGRVGRLLITLVLHQAGILREPLLYLSLFLKEHRSKYYRLLDEVRTNGDWEAWLIFFLAGVCETADGAVATARSLSGLFQRDRDRIAGVGRRAGSMFRVHEVLKARPLASLPEVCRISRLSFPTASQSMEGLADLGIVRELTGRQRNRVFAYDRYLEILSEGTAA